MPGQTQKGNPASKRMSSTAHKAVRERSWYRGVARKQRRAKAQRERELRNRELRAAGEQVAWEVACAARRQRRVDAGLHAAWLKRQVSL